MSRVSAASYLMQFLIDFKTPVVSTLEMSTVGLITQRLVADPAEHEASCFVRHPELDIAR